MKLQIIPRLQALLPLGTQMGYKWSKWEFAQPTKLSAANSSFPVLGRGKLLWGKQLSSIKLVLQQEIPASLPQPSSTGISSGVLSIGTNAWLLSLILQFTGDKYHLNPATAQFCLNIEIILLNFEFSYLYNIN
jgi:hypothetical protein